MSDAYTTEIYFSSDWNEAWLGNEDELRIEVSGEASYTTDGGTVWRSAFQNREHVFRAHGRTTSAFAGLSSSQS